MNELLATIHMPDGSIVEIKRDDYDIQICREEHCATLPGASARQALEFFALLDSLGTSTELPEG